MAVNKLSSRRKPSIQTSGTRLRHVWLAGLGLVVVASRQAKTAAEEAATRVDSLKQQAAKLAGVAQANVRGGMASVREKGEAGVAEFNTRVEVRLQPVLFKLGLKREPRPAKRVPRQRARV